MSPGCCAAASRIRGRFISYLLNFIKHPSQTTVVFSIFLFVSVERSVCRGKWRSPQDEYRRIVRSLLLASPVYLSPILHYSPQFRFWLSRCLVVRLFAHRASFRFLGYVSSFGQSVLHLKARISKQRNGFYVRAVSDCPARSIGRSRPVFLNLEYRPVGLLLPREKFRQATVIESDVFCSSRGKFLEFSPRDAPCFLYGL